MHESELGRMFEAVSLMRPSAESEWIRHLHSLDIPTAKHFCSRQYWQRFLVILLMLQFLSRWQVYTMSFWTLRRKKPCRGNGRVKRRCLPEYGNNPAWTSRGNHFENVNSYTSYWIWQNTMSILYECTLLTILTSLIKVASRYPLNVEIFHWKNQRFDLLVALEEWSGDHNIKEASCGNHWCLYKT